MAYDATDFSNPSKRACYLGGGMNHDVESTYTSTTEKIEVIYQQLLLPTIPENLEHNIKFTIYSCCIKNKTDFLGLDFVAFVKKQIPYFISTFGFSFIQACEITITYANNTVWLFTFDIKLSDLIVFDWYGFFSEDVRFRIRELENTTSLSLLHHDNPLFEEANNLVTIINHIIHPKFIVLIVYYIYLINHHTDFVIRSYSGSDHVNKLKELFKIYSHTKKCIDLERMLTDLIFRIEFPDELY